MLTTTELQVVLDAAKQKKVAWKGGNTWGTKTKL